ncbi:hypothetical protein K438DRAFT_1787106 [Mycena galopus ATCC 62051]|nr:hypothetical protein K438DRAFT_1787106 [Mycena galopus ATCC 62051]
MACCAKHDPAPMPLTRRLCGHLGTSICYAHTPARTPIFVHAPTGRFPMYAPLVRRLRTPATVRTPCHRTHALHARPWLAHARISIALLFVTCAQPAYRLHTARSSIACARSPTALYSIDNKPVFEPYLGNQDTHEVADLLRQIVRGAREALEGALQQRCSFLERTPEQLGILKCGALQHRQDKDEEADGTAGLRAEAGGGGVGGAGHGCKVLVDSERGRACAPQACTVGGARGLRGDARRNSTWTSGCGYKEHGVSSSARASMTWRAREHNEHTAPPLHRCKRRLCVRASTSSHPQSMCPALLRRAQQQVDPKQKAVSYASTGLIFIFFQPSLSVIPRCCLLTVLRSCLVLEGPTHYDRAVWNSCNMMQYTGEGFSSDGTEEAWSFLRRVGGGAAMMSFLLLLRVGLGNLNCDPNASGRCLADHELASRWTLWRTNMSGASQARTASVHGRGKQDVGTEVHVEAPNLQVQNHVSAVSQARGEAAEADSKKERDDERDRQSRAADDCGACHGER